MSWRVGVRRFDEGVPGVDEAGQVTTAPREGRTELVDHRDEVASRHGRHQSVQVHEQLRRGQRRPRLGTRNPRPVLEVGRTATAGLEVDVLLADRGAVGDDGHCVSRHPAVVVEDQLDAHPRRRGDQRSDPPHGDATVSHLGALEDSTRFGEVGVDAVRPADEARPEPDVPSAHEADTHHGEREEHGELDPGRLRDHRTPTSSSRARCAA